MENTSDPKAKKLSIEEYEKLKAQRAKKRIVFNFPWPVVLALAVPALFLIILFLGYSLYIHNLAK